MVSYGYKTVEEFYSKSSSRELVDNVKIPVIFIQAGAPFFSYFMHFKSSMSANFMFVQFTQKSSFLWMVATVGRYFIGSSYLTRLCYKENLMHGLIILRGNGNH